MSNIGSRFSLVVEEIFRFHMVFRAGVGALICNYKVRIFNCNKSGSTGTYIVPCWRVMHGFILIVCRF